jgi:cell division FtsZ-interacting protein ZapD
VPDLNRRHDVRTLTASELKRARRGLQSSLALIRADSPTRESILAQLQAIDAELAERGAAGAADEVTS